jgi:hypothetical protein
MAHSVPEADVLAEANAAGWRLLRRHKVVASQFFLIFAPRAEQLRVSGTR